MAAVPISIAPDRPIELLQLREAFRAELAAIADAHARHDVSTARWQTYAHVRTALQRPEHSAVENLAVQVMAQVVHIARDTLSRPGAPLACDIEPWIEKNYYAKQRRLQERSRRDSHAHELWAEFDPLDLWDHIVVTYSPQRVIDEARKRAAIALIDAFGLGAGHSVKQVGGRIELEIRRYSEPVFNSTERRYGHYDDRLMRPLVEAMEVFQVAAAISGSSTPLTLLGQLLYDSAQYSFTFSSRDTRDLGAGIRVVFFNSAVKVFLPHAIAVALNLFVSQYGQERLAERAY